MALSLRRGVVTAGLERHPELVRLEVDGLPCVAYPRLTGPVEEGDDVVVNEQARLLGLGSGGFDVLHANLTRGLGAAAEPGAPGVELPHPGPRRSARAPRPPGASPPSSPPAARCRSRCRTRCGRSRRPGGSRSRSPPV